MLESILQFGQSGIPELVQIQESFFDDPTKIAEFIRGGSDVFLQAALDFFGETFTRLDEHLRNNFCRKQEWYIVRRDEASTLCSIGRINYQKTLFMNRKTGERRYLADDLFGFEPHERMTEDALVKLLDEAADSSYRKSGMTTSIMEEVSKQTVMNKVHDLKFPPEQKRPGRKKKVEYLYIDADEDHVALQYDQAKGDLRHGQHACVMPRLVYVYEGIEADGPEPSRHHLVNAQYFGGVYDGGPRELWEEVDHYIRNHYDLTTIRKIYIHGDGAGWIRSGCDVIGSSQFVLDRYHMHKYIIVATSHLLDSKEDARSAVYRAIHHRKKYEAREVFEHILAVTDSESKQKAVQASMDYILNNWAGIMASLKDKEHQTGCSAEGHVSHVLSDRLSSRPLGWSRIGADRMTRLRVYKQNGGDLLALVRYQKKPVQKAAGAEGYEALEYYDRRGLLASENSHRGELGKYCDVFRASIVEGTARKTAAIRWHLWDI